MTVSWRPHSEHDCCRHDDGNDENDGNEQRVHASVLRLVHQ
jgi:hypothetical protein